MGEKLAHPFFFGDSKMVTIKILKAGPETIKAMRGIYMPAGSQMTYADSAFARKLAEEHPDKVCIVHDSSEVGAAEATQEKAAKPKRNKMLAKTERTKTK